MKWLTLPLCKAQIRMEPDFTAEDEILTQYAEDAEEMVLGDTRRTVEELKAMNTDDPTRVPASIVQASLLLFTLSYEQHSPISMQNMYAVPYAYDHKIKRFIKLTED